MSRSAGTVLLAALRRDPPAWAIAGLTRLDVVELAEVHGILPVVAEVAMRHGAIPDLEGAPVLPDRREALSPTAVLLAAREEGRARHADLDEIRAIAVRELAGADVRFRHLKGGALHSAGVWKDFTARPTRDVDILVDDVLAIPRIESALLTLGFEHSDDVETSRAWEDDHHDRPLVLAGRAGSLELHAAALVRRHRDRMTLDLPAATEQPDLAATLRHIILHAQLQDDALLQFRLPLVSLLDVAFAIETGAVTTSELIDGFDDRAARHAARVHLGLVARLRDSRVAGGRASWLRWRVSRILFGHPRLAHLAREAAFAPRALSRPVMTAREGHPLSGTALAGARLRFLRERVPRGIRAGQDDAPAAPAAPPARRGGRRMSDSADAATLPAQAPGFEAVWSSSGLVLVDLGTDVLHHLNAPAAVVYELVGGRSVSELADAYAALGEVDVAEARDAVEAALDSLAGIGAVSGWPLS